MTKTFKNKALTKSLVSGAAAIGAIAGVGLASAPAQAGTFTITPQNITPSGNISPRTFVDQDSEWGFPGPEPIWSSWPDDGIPNPPGPGNSEGCAHGFTDCVNGWDNPLISHTGSTDGDFLFEYFGSGTSTQTNNFLWNGQSLFGARTGTQPPPDSFAKSLPPSPVFKPLINGALPFEFTTNRPAPGVTVENNETIQGQIGTPKCNPTPTSPTCNDGENVRGAHYFATIDGTWVTTSGDVVYLGFSDGNSGTGSSDDDAADYVIKITSQQKVPEPGTMLGLLAVGGLGVALKRKKQEG